MSSLSYFDIAMKSYSNIDKQFHLAEEMNWYNLFAAECAQIIEKMLKGILSLLELPEDTSPHIFDTHSLQVLTRILHSIYPNTINVQNAAWLSDYYFDTKYPGDTFVEVSKYDAEQILSITRDLADNLITLYNNLTEAKKTNFFGGC